MPNNHEWPTVTFGDVVQEITVHEREPESQGLERYVGLDHLDPGDPRVRRWGLISEGVTFTKVFRAGQILFGKRRVYQKKMGVPDFDGLCSGDIIVLDTKDKRLSREFLALVVQTEAFFAHAEKTSSGSLSPRTKFRELAKFEFLLPPPEQQRELVELMQGFERAIEAGEDVIEAQVTLTGAVVEHGYADVAASQRCDELCDEITVGVVVKPASYYVSEGVPALRSLNVLPNKLNMDNLVFFSQESNNLLTKSRLRQGDVLVVRSGTPGIACAVPKDAIGINCIDLIIVRPSKDKLDSRYLAYFLNSEQGKRQTARHAGGLAQQHVNVGALKTVEVPLLPLEQQRDLVERVSASLTQHELVELHLTRIKELRFSILNTALSPSATAEAAAEVPA